MEWREWYSSTSIYLKWLIFMIIWLNRLRALMFFLICNWFWRSWFWFTRWTLMISCLSASHLTLTSRNPKLRHCETLQENYFSVLSLALTQVLILSSVQTPKYMCYIQNHNKRILPSPQSGTSPTLDHSPHSDHWGNSKSHILRNGSTRTFIESP